MLLFYHNVLHLSSAFSNKFQIFHPFFLFYLFLFRFSGANPPFSPLKQMRKLGLSQNYFLLLLIKILLLLINIIADGFFSYVPPIKKSVTSSVTLFYCHFKIQLFHFNIYSEHITMVILFQYPRCTQVVVYMHDYQLQKALLRFSTHDARGLQQLTMLNLNLAKSCFSTHDARGLQYSSLGQQRKLLSFSTHDARGLQ